MPTTDDAQGVASKFPVSQLRKIALRLHAADVLNTDDNGRSLSVVARVYKLRDKEAFMAAPYADFQELKGAKPPGFAADVVDVKEVVMTPGKQYDVIETVGVDAPYFAVVVLFRAPAEQRWRFVFDSKSAASTGVTMGVHACSMSVSAGQALDVAPEMLRVAGVRCPAS
jgi:type VI secretion system protein VasD